ncbi:phosphoenolpyruvate carboxykinase (ATP) [Candidatus Latescibacterota bacterium]
MASLSSIEFYANSQEDLKDISSLRAIAETAWNTGIDLKKPIVTVDEAYGFAIKQPNIAFTDLPFYEPVRKRLELRKNAKLFVDNHGAIIGRKAKARVFYNLAPVQLTPNLKLTKTEIEEIIRDAIYDMQRRSNILRASAVVGTHPEFMIRANYLTCEEDSVNVFEWLINFTPYEGETVEKYKNSKPLNVKDIFIIADPLWTSKDKFPNEDFTNFFRDGMVVVDPYNNVIFNMGMRYIGERKKGTLTLGWTSAIRLGGVACHGGIKTVDFSETDYPELKEKKIAFFGLSGSGKSSHTNSLDNGGSLPRGSKTTVHHDDAFVVFPERKVCYVLEPTLFDKMDQRGIDHPEWKYVLAAQNCGVFMRDGKLIPVGQDLKNPNSRAMLDRDLLRNYSDSTGFPDAICWLMKDSTLPPIVRFDDINLGLAMGATLMTKRTAAENVPIEEMKKLVFEPFANPFRVYELWRDCAAFKTLIEEGSIVYIFNSGGFWGGGFDDLGRETLTPIPLETSHKLHTAVLMDQIEWCAWDLLPGALIPSADSINKLIPEYSTMYDPKNIHNYESYIHTMKDRFKQRQDFLEDSFHKEGNKIFLELIAVLKPNLPKIGYSDIDGAPGMSPPKRRADTEAE